MTHFGNNVRLPLLQILLSPRCFFTKLVIIAVFRAIKSVRNWYYSLAYRRGQRIIDARFESRCLVASDEFTWLHSLGATLNLANVWSSEITFHRFNIYYCLKNSDSREQWLLQHDSYGTPFLICLAFVTIIHPITRDDPRPTGSSSKFTPSLDSLEVNKLHEPKSVVALDHHLISSLLWNNHELLTLCRRSIWK
jgi:hypothetical protein